MNLDKILDPESIREFIDGARTIENDSLRNSESIEHFIAGVFYVVALESGELSVDEYMQLEAEVRNKIYQAIIFQDATESI